MQYIKTICHKLKLILQNRWLKFFSSVKNTVYKLIGKGEIIAKRVGKVYRIPISSISFIFSGMDEDILRKQMEDEVNLEKVSKVIGEVRGEIWEKSEYL